MRDVKERESDIVSAICDYLAARHHFYWRQNIAPTFDSTKGVFRRMPKHALRGVPDIILIKNGGRFVGDLLPNMPSFIRRICSSFAPAWGVLRTQLV
jgi:hypothetical protein